MLLNVISFLQKKFYTIILVDPDAPPQVEGEFYLHLLKSNIPVSKQIKDLVVDVSLISCVIGLTFYDFIVWFNEIVCKSNKVYIIFHKIIYDSQGLALKSKESSKTAGIDYRGEI